MYYAQTIIINLFLINNLRLFFKGPKNLTKYKTVHYLFYLKNLFFPLINCFKSLIPKQTAMPTVDI
jgi:hypothetical protein